MAVRKIRSRGTNPPIAKCEEDVERQNAELAKEEKVKREKNKRDSRQKKEAAKKTEKAKHKLRKGPESDEDGDPQLGGDDSSCEEVSIRFLKLRPCCSFFAVDILGELT